MLEYVIEKLKTAKVQKEPFSYFFTEEIFPPEKYRELLDYLPEEQYYHPLSAGAAVRPGTYGERHCLPLEPNQLAALPFPQLMFWTCFLEEMQSDRLIRAIFDLFPSEFKNRFGEKKVRFAPDLGLISDRSHYAIGPHTDHPQKVLSLLFYLPRDTTQSQLGTSIYQPKDPAFRCEGFKHHSFEGFTKIYSAPFIPNSVFGFFKSNCSFHGVEPIGPQESPRNLLSYQFLLDDL